MAVDVKRRTSLFLNKKWFLLPNTASTHSCEYSSHVVVTVNCDMLHRGARPTTRMHNDTSLFILQTKILRLT